MVQCILEGGLGNNLFQMATTIAHSINHGFEYSIPMKIQTPHSLGQVPYLSKNIKYVKEVDTSLEIYKEQGYRYSEIPPIDNICLSGYFQSYKYFFYCRDEILKAFDFRWEEKKNYCSVHIRIGDYMDTPDCHPIITKRYIFEAMMEVMTRVINWEDIKFLVFSDTMWQAKLMLDSAEFKSFPIEYCNEINPVKALELMSGCNHNIGSASAMSFWAHYLNQSPDKIGIFPAVWFGKSLQHDTSDLLLPNWITI